MIERAVLFAGLDISQLRLVAKHAMESSRTSYGELKQTEDGNALASLVESNMKCQSEDLILIDHGNGKQTLTEVCESSQKSMSETVLPEKRVKQDEAEDTRDLTDSFIPNALGHTEAEDFIYSNTIDNSGTSIPLSEDIKTALELASMTTTSENCIKLDGSSMVLEKRNYAVNGSDVISSACTDDRKEDVIDSLSGNEFNTLNCVGNNGMVQDSFTQSSMLQIGEKNLLDTKESVRGSHGDGFRKDDKIFGDLCAHHLTDICAVETIDVSVNEMATLKVFQLDLKDLCEDQKNDGTTDVTAESSQQTEDNACGSKASSSMKGSSFILDVPDLLGEVPVRVLSTSNAVNCLASTDNKIKESVETACVSELNCCDAAFSYFRRRGQEGKLSQKAQAKRIPFGSRKATIEKHFQENIESIFRCARQKRSCCSKPRASEWGSSRSIGKKLCHSDNLPSKEAPNPASRGPQDFQIIREQSKDCLSGSPKGSSRRTQASSGSRIRLKVKFGKTGGPNPMNNKISEGADCSLSIGGRGIDSHQGAFIEVPKSAACVGNIYANEETKGHTEDNSPKKKIGDRDPLDCPTNTEQNYKELESGMFCKKSAGDVANNYLKTDLNKLHEESARPTENQLEAETSPDSEVIDSMPDALVGTDHQGDLHHDAVRSKGFSSPADLDVEKMGKKKEQKKDGANEFKTRKNRQSRHKVESISGEIVSFSSSEMAACNKIKGHGLPIISQSNKLKEKSEFSKSRRKNASGNKKGQQKPLNRNKGMKESAGDQDVGRFGILHEIGGRTTDAITSSDTIEHVGFPKVANGSMLLDAAVKENASYDSAWVRCDVCFKWRRMSASLVESIGDNCRWVCNDNVDKNMADCSIPQEMSNEDINAQLGMTQAEADAYDCDLKLKEVGKGEGKCVPGNQKACFKAIKVNQFLHRNRKAQTIDEVMVCHCKPPLDGQLGCRDECLNRMLNIECVHGTCPCGDLCSNQQFQKRKYVKFQRFQTGKKGNGLKLLHDVRQGQFLIEYVGEVLDMQAYEARQKEYAANGQKHFYFMTLNGNEVIDAGVKGNLGRFINHSCEPNCRTEKWMVNGEICVGIFAIRDIKKAEELTFDYNYVRVFGAAAKKCHCGSAHCRGYIGGDPSNDDVVVQSDSDEKYEEPAIPEDDDNVDGLLEATSGICTDGAEAHIAQNMETEITYDFRTDIQSSVATEIEDSKGHADLNCLKIPNSAGIEDVEKLSCPFKPPEASFAAGGVRIRSVAVVQDDSLVEGGSTSRSFNQVLETSTSTASKLSSDYTDVEKKSKYSSGEDSKIVRRMRPLMKTSRSSGSCRREKGASDPVVGSKEQTLASSKPQQQPNKSRVTSEVSSSGRLETIEEKLNELMDAEGGISKWKDSVKGYLKLLLLTAASRGSASNEGIQSNRDLSMILDALLKTKSRSVLVDVISKNGVQMLHNIMKQCRGDFKRIPILRKVLKVLEYLAAREILNLEHIVRGPPCVGMESFRDSMLTLTEHDDKQVHQIARNFRDRWIPKSFRRPRYMNRDESRMEFHRETIYNGFSSAQSCHNHDVHPTEPVPSISPFVVATDSENASVLITSDSQTDGTKLRKRKSRWDQPAMKKEPRTEDTLLLQQSEAICKDKMATDQDNCDDIPPGFSPAARKQTPGPSKASPDYVVAHPQPKFQSRLPISYGIPLNIMQEFGTPHAEAPDSWEVAPGMPFHPFPPLPPFPRVSRGNGNGQLASSVNSTTASEEGLSATCAGLDNAIISSQKRPRGYDLGRDYFRQQKRNSPPWIGNGWSGDGNQC